MIHAIVMSTGSAQALAHTLSDLVAGAVEGVVRRVAVAAPADADEALFEVSDDAGASFRRLPGSYGARAAAAVGGDWLMVLDAGVRLPANWHAAAGDHVRKRPGQSALIVGDKAGLFGGRAVLALIAPRSVYDKAGGFSDGDADLKALVRRLERSGRAARL